MQPKKALGIAGEELIAQRLKTEGFAIISQNYSKQFGEIDLIARKNDLIIFVEVKARRKPLFDMAEIISQSKQRKIIAVAKHFLAYHNINDAYCRFDVALIEYEPDDPKVSYIQNAFCE